MKNLAASFAGFLFLSNSAASWACSPCRPLVQTNVYNQDFGANIVLLLLPLAVLAIVATAIHFFSDSLFR
jgi:hypothetical protein